MEAPPAIAAIVPKIIKTLSTPSEYLNKESNETGFILGLYTFSDVRRGLFKSF